MGIEELVVKHRLERGEIAAAHRRIALVSRARISLSLLIARPPLQFHQALRACSLPGAFSHSITSSALPGHPPFAERVLRNIGSGLPRQSGLMFAARITLPHFSVSSATSFPNSAGVIGMGSPASSATRVCNFGSANTAFTA